MGLIEFQLLVHETINMQSDELLSFTEDMMDDVMDIS